MSGYGCPDDVLLHADRISKVYPGTKALDDVSFDLLKGKVNVLIGENGAGKSTLMKIIAGIEQPSSGTLYIGDAEVSFKDTTEARRHGIGIIHQELSLFPNLNVYQNIFMNREHRRGLSLDDAYHVDASKKVLDLLEHPMDPTTRVGSLRVGQQQMIEIARELVDDDLQVLIMDEPTSSLSQQEVQVLFRIMRELTASGLSIVYISHRLEEVMEIGDHVTILRDGRYVDDADVKDISISWIVQKMTGGEKQYPKRDRVVDWDAQPKVLEVSDLCLPKPGGGYLVDHVSFDLRKGEVLGIYGLLGAGRTEVFECIMGLRPEHTGTVRLNGRPITIGSVSQMIDAGISLIPEDRQGGGLVQTLDIEKNVSLAALKRYRKGPLIDSVTEDRRVDEEIRDIHIKVADKHLPILSLSGGNQQKVVIAKGLLTEPQILLMDEPSRGIDIGAKTEVYEIIDKYARRGLSIIVISSELEEIIAISDRILVLSNGRLTGEFAGGHIDKDALALASYKGHHAVKAEKEN